MRQTFAFFVVLGGIFITLFWRGQSKTSVVRSDQVPLEKVHTEARFLLFGGEKTVHGLLQMFEDKERAVTALSVDGTILGTPTQSSRLTSRSRSQHR